MGVLVRSGRGLRDEFSRFYSSAYPELVAQSLAITGDAHLAKSATQTTLARAWHSWPTLRQARDPLVRTRWTAVLVVAEQGAAPAKAGEATSGEVTEDAVVVAALQLLPPVQRRAIVLHYLGDVSVNDLAALSGSSAEHIELLLDNGFTKLAETLDWSEEDVHAEGHAGEGDKDDPPGPDDELDDLDLRFDWTAEALADTAARLPHEITAPSPAAMLRRAALVRWSKRAAPVAACAACVAVAVVVAGQPASSSEAGLPAIYAQNDNNDSTTPIDNGSIPTYADPYLAAPVQGAAGAQAGAPVRLRSVVLTGLLNPVTAGTAGNQGSSGSTGGTAGSVVSSGGSSGTGGTASTGGTAATGGSAAASGGTTGTTSPTTGGTTTTSSTPTTPPVTTTTPPVTTTPPITTTDPTTTTTTPPVTTDPTTTTPPPVTTTPPTTTTTPTTVATTTTEVTTTTTTTTASSEETTSADETTSAEKTTTEHSDADTTDDTKKA